MVPPTVAFQLTSCRRDQSCSFRGQIQFVSQSPLMTPRPAAWLASSELIYPELIWCYSFPPHRRHRRQPDHHRCVCRSISQHVVSDDEERRRRRKNLCELSTRFAFLNDFISGWRKGHYHQNSEPAAAAAAAAVNAGTWRWRRKYRMSLFSWPFLTYVWAHLGRDSNPQLRSGSRVVCRADQNLKLSACLKSWTLLLVWKNDLS